MTEQTLTRAEQKRHCNKAQLAELFEVYPSTVDGWIRKGMPYVVRGSLSKPWTFDARNVLEWRFTHDAPAPPVSPDDMVPTDRRAWYDSEVLRRRLQERDRELVAVEDAKAAVETALAVIREGVNEIPDKLVAAGVPDAVITSARDALKAELAALTDRVGVLTRG